MSCFNELIKIIEWGTNNVIITQFVSPFSDPSVYDKLLPSQLGN